MPSASDSPVPERLRLRRSPAGGTGAGLTAEGAPSAAGAEPPSAAFALRAEEGEETSDSPAPRRARPRIVAAPEAPGDAALARATEAALADALRQALADAPAAPSAAAPLSSTAPSPAAPLPLGVAVSGGGDSLALLLALHALPGLRLEAATIDHRLRPEAAAEAAWVGEICAARRIPHRILRWTDRPAAGNLAAAAREARAGLLAQWARERGLVAVALGHTLDDQAETLLLRLARGSGLDGLSAMRPAARRLRTLWLRPALSLRREALRACLRHRGQGWVEDPSNDDLAHDRPRARKALAGLSDLGLTAEGLAATAARLADDSDALRAEADRLQSRLLSIGAAGELRLPRAPFAEAPAQLRRRLLARLLRDLPGRAHPPRQAALSALDAALCAPAPLSGRSLQGCRIVADAQTIVIHREPSALSPGEDGAQLWDGRWRFDPPPPGAHPGPLGAAGLRALAEARKIRVWRPCPEWNAAPRAARAASPALWRGSRLLAAPLACHSTEDCATFGFSDLLSAPELR